MNLHAISLTQTVQYVSGLMQAVIQALKEITLPLTPDINRSQQQTTECVDHGSATR